MQTSTRNANLNDLVGLLQTQHDAKHDVVVPAREIMSLDGQLSWGDGGFYNPTALADEGLANKFDIPRSYLKRLRAEHIAQLVEDADQSYDLESSAMKALELAAN